jgi:DNA-binding CsgD family transcriptional regulator
MHAFLADALVGAADLSLGKRPRELARMLEAITHAGEFDDQRLLIWAAIAAEVAGDDNLEAQLLARAVALARASGAVDRLTVALESAAVQGFLAGQYSVTAEATEGLRLAREAGLSNAATLHLATLTWLAAVRGREDECRSHAARVHEAARAYGHGIANAIAEWGLALLDLGIGRPEETATRLIALSTAPPGIGHPLYVLKSAPDLIEACMRTGKSDVAETAFVLVDEFAQPGAPTWALALAARCRAQLAEGETAEREFANALQLHAGSTNGFERARTELLYGEFLRRARRRIDAREQLRAALDAFERLRTEPWAERARTELRATGETARKRDLSTIDELTPQELQIARLVAEGSSNKEVAAQLFLSPRTVEYHLRKVFTKLGISSRSELIKQGIAEDAQPEPGAVAAS